VIFILPNLVTLSRVAFGTAAFAAAADGDFRQSATLICLGGVSDGLDGFLARRFGAVSAFGALFDYVADYVCYVVAPWLVARAMLAPNSSAQELLLATPLLTGAIRYGRNGLIVVKPNAADLPGLATVFFAFLIVAVIFGGVVPLLAHPTAKLILLAMILLFACMMIAPVRYPKLTRFRGASPVVLVLIAIMPFAASRLLAEIMFVVGLAFALGAPVLGVRRRSVKYLDKLLSIVAGVLWQGFRAASLAHSRKSMTPAWSFVYSEMV
jgi:phosphatidylserine synthase